MTHTIKTYTAQCASHGVIENVENTVKTQADENISDILSVCDSLNRLHEKLSRLAYVLQRMNIEKSLSNKL